MNAVLSSLARCARTASIAIVLLLLPLGEYAAAQSAGRESYDQLIARARDAFSSGRYREARDAFREAHAHAPSARTSWGVGIAEYELHHYGAAERSMRAALDDRRKPLPAPERAKAEQLLRWVETRTGTLRIATDAPGAALTIDGEPVDDPEQAQRLEEGRHQVALREAGREPVQREVEIRAGGELSIELVLTAHAEAPPPEPPPASERDVRGPRALAWSVLGTGAALTVAGVVALARARHHARIVDDARDGAEWSEIHDANQRANLLTGLGAGFSAAGLATAAVGAWLVARRSDERQQQARILLGPRGAALRFAF